MATDPRNATVAAYDTDARAYAEAGATMPEEVRRDIEEFAAVVGSGGRVLEIGSGGGRDAALLEQLGLRVRRTDVTPGFVDLLRSQGHEADLVDPLVDDLASAEGPYDAIWSNAALLHVDRADLPTVLRRLAAVVCSGGVLRFSVKEGDGDGWSTHGAVSAPRHFTYWRHDALVEAVRDAGWADVRATSGVAGKRGETWLEVWAVLG